MLVDSTPEQEICVCLHPVVVLGKGVWLLTRQGLVCGETQSACGGGLKTKPQGMWGDLIPASIEAHLEFDELIPVAHVAVLPQIQLHKCTYAGERKVDLTRVWFCQLRWREMGKEVSYTKSIPNPSPMVQNRPQLILPPTFFFFFNSGWFVFYRCLTWSFFFPLPLLHQFCLAPTVSSMGIPGAWGSEQL